MQVENKQVCALGVWDSTIPGIVFDEYGISNYARIQQNLMSDFPRGDKGKKDWSVLVTKVKEAGKNRRYDCIIGVSGGTDSSYLLHIAHEYGLRPLAVNLDNGWNSDIAVKNIKKVTAALNIDLETYVIDYEEIKDILKAYMRAGLPWIDNPTDQAIHSILYRKAIEEKIGFILIGTDFRSEGKQPSEWTYGDSKQLKYIVKRFGTTRIKTYPVVSFPKMAYYNYLRKIKVILPFNYINYKKNEAQEFLKKQYGWEYYGEHHHENIFTKWAIGHWMYTKFGMDKRIITYSSQILSGEMTREDVLTKISIPPYDIAGAERDTLYIIKKLGFRQEEFDTIWKDTNKTIFDYPSYYQTIVKYSRFLSPLIKYIFKNKPKFFYELEGKAKH
ncbi:MAG: N-acetyl sugar amidotransferase [Bacteroidetes bacterium]|nr:N-acetyl sugar amidotransferase [Bacteroidota bacterium]